MWKTFEGQGSANREVGYGGPGVRAGDRVGGGTLEACSACAGDYENPDRTANVADEFADEVAVEERSEPDEDELREWEHESRERQAGAEEFPGR